MFPIMIDYRGTPGPCPSQIPWDAIAPYDGQARVNHQQTLERLAERGGLSPAEAFMVMHGRSWRDLTGVNYEPLQKEACAFLDKLVRDRQEQRADLTLAIKYLKEGDHAYNHVIQDFIERVEKSLTA